MLPLLPDESIKRQLHNVLELILSFNDSNYLNDIAENKETLKQAIKNLSSAIGFIHNILAEKFLSEEEHDDDIKPIVN